MSNVCEDGVFLWFYSGSEYPVIPCRDGGHYQNLVILVKRLESAISKESYWP